MKKIIKLFSITFLALALFAVANTYRVVAQTTASVPETKMEVVKLATVNIYDATSTKINNKTYSVSFVFTNREGIQPNIRYGIQLIRRYNNKPIDIYLVNKAITLGENDQKEITLEYTIPDYISDGVYRMLIVAQNQNGLLLATSPTSFPEKYITIENSSGLDVDKCYLKVEGDDPNTTYAFGEGVTIKAGVEKLIASCEITNNTLKGDDLRLQLITHKRDQLGDILTNEILPDPITIKGKSTQTITFPVPTQTTPQAYDIDTFLINSKGEKVSYSVFLHYVISGVSATIQNVLMDKTNYVAGDEAQVKVLWTASADTFSFSRLPGSDATYRTKIDIKDSNGNICGSVNKKVATPEILGEDLIKVAIDKTCDGAIAEVSILDDNGNVLDTTKIDLNNPVTNVQINANIPKASFSFANANAIYVVVLILVLVLIAVGILLLKKQKVEDK
ncbi:hypothetical protein SDC9_21738 [bioreactor metagenome]|uniref:Uncharacterized protein n=1 Tax=bioreactor metagenome TaxID=1076179 RepID=A0A644UAK2_9ZZZZ|nr:hypothetical protein [Candidatus Elulimicrobiales bacterium]